MEAPNNSRLTGSGRTCLTVFLPVLAVALAARAVLLTVWFKSPVRFYGTVSGLDMQTLLNYGREFAEGRGPFSLYRVLLALVLRTFGERHYGDVVIIAQMCLGVITALLITDIVRRLTENRAAALVTGIVVALYAPALMYELLHLRAALFLFTGAVSLYVLVCWCTGRDRPRMGWWRLGGVGVIVALPALVRFAGVLWTVFALAYLALVAVVEWWPMREDLIAGRRPSLTVSSVRILGPALLGSILMFGAVTVYNWHHTGVATPFGANISYALAVGSTPSPTSLDLPAASVPGGQEREQARQTILARLKTYGQKSLAVFRAFEVTNNVNYYFLRQALPPLRYMIGPLLLLPLGTTGFLFLLGTGRLFRKNTVVILLYLAAFTVPMVLFVPLARYRLALLPFFAVCAALPVSAVRAMPRPRARMTALLLLVTYLLVLAWSVPRNIPLRDEDFVTYAIAAANGNFSKSVQENAYRQALQLDPASAAAGLNLAHLLFERRHFQAAHKILGPVYEQHPDDGSVVLMYAISLLGSGQPAAAEQVIEPWIRRHAKQASSRMYYNLAEAERLQGKTQEARQHYEEAKKHAATEDQTGLANAGLQKLRQ